MDCPRCKAPGMCVCPSEPRRPTLDDVLAQVRTEVARAESLWPPQNSAHEGYAVILEELDELKAHVWMKQTQRDIAAMRKEAIEVAAMAVRFIRDVCDRDRGRA